MNPEFHRRREALGLKALCGIAIATILVGSLWPFNPLPPNKVSWLSDANGLRFAGKGLVLSRASLRIGAESGKSCSLELLLRPASTKSSYTILSFYNPKAPKQLVVRQWTDGLLVTSDFLDIENRPPGSKFDVNHALQRDRLTLLTITSGAAGTVVYLDGSQVETFPKFVITQSQLAGQIVLGTSPVEYQPWPGEIHGLAVYAKELSAAEVSRHYKGWTVGQGIAALNLEGAAACYIFDERKGNEIHNTVAPEPSLEIPKYFAIPHKAMLTSPVKEFQPTRQYVADVLMNIAGFVPLGFILSTYLRLRHTRRQAVLYATLAGVLLSLLIEVVQAYIPQRVSGMTDIITNGTGTGLGALFGQTALLRTIFQRIGPGAGDGRAKEPVSGRAISTGVRTVGGRPEEEG